MISNMTKLPPECHVHPSLPRSAGSLSEFGRLQNISILSDILDAQLVSETAEYLYCINAS